MSNGKFITDLDTRAIRNSINSLASTIFGEYDIELEEIVIFGSYGRGSATESSDLDVLLVVELVSSFSDVERRDTFRGLATQFENKLPNKLPPEINGVDCLISTYMNRDKVLMDCLEEVSSDELQESPCLAYSLTEEEQIQTIHP